MVRQKHDIDKRLQDSTLSSNQDFIGKMEFFFNRFSQARDDNLRQTVSVVDPIGKVLDKLQKQIDEMQKYRISSDSNIQNNIYNVIKLQENLTQETHKLRNILRKPNSRGKWGEIQLQRIAEISGMLPFCEFETQNTSFDGIRPDMTVKIPNGGILFVDAKTPLDAYFKGLDDEYSNEEVLKENLKSIKTHIYSLGNKDYWKRGKSPDFVIMFIPMEHIWLSALELDANLIEYASERNVVVATPMTLIALMKTIFIGWSQIKFAEEAENLKKSFQFIEALIKPTVANLDKMQKYQNNILDISNEIRTNMRKIDIEMGKYDGASSLSDLAKDLSNPIVDLPLSNSLNEKVDLPLNNGLNEQVDLPLNNGLNEKVDLPLNNSFNEKMNLPLSNSFNEKVNKNLSSIDIEKSENMLPMKDLFSKDIEKIENTLPMTEKFQNEELNPIKDIFSKIVEESVLNFDLNSGKNNSGFNNPSLSNNINSGFNNPSSSSNINSGLNSSFNNNSGFNNPSSSNINSGFNNPSSSNINSGFNNPSSSNNNNSGLNSSFNNSNLSLNPKPLDDNTNNSSFNQNNNKLDLDLKNILNKIGEEEKYSVQPVLNNETNNNSNNTEEKLMLLKKILKEND